jgi:hypothetical protein
VATARQSIKPQALAWALVAAFALFLHLSKQKKQPLPFEPERSPPEPLSGRNAVVQIAENEVGQNDANKYWAAILPPGSERPEHSWCGAFALWVLRAAGLTAWQYDNDGAWFYQLPWTDDPAPGDLAFIESKRHLGIVKSVNQDGTVTLINGAGTGNRVSVGPTARSNVTEFRSIAPLLRAA